MSTYVLTGFLLQEGADERILFVGDSLVEVVVPDAVTRFTTEIVEVTEDGEALLELIVSDNDTRLNGRSIYSYDALDLGIAEVAWSFGGAQGTSILAVGFDNEAFQANIFRLGGDALPAAAFATPIAAETFIGSAVITDPARASTGFAPGQQIDLQGLPGVTVTEEDYVSDNRNFEATDRSYDLGIGSDIFDAGIGSDTVDGGAGSDIVHYEFMTGPIIANLTDAPRDGVAPGQVRKDGGTDTLISIENLLGSNFSDRIYLPDGAGFVFDRAGDDRVQAAEGNTIFVSGSGADTLIGGAGDDLLIFADDTFDGAGLATQGIVLTMTGVGRGTVVDGWGFTDIFGGIGTFNGSQLDDVFEGAGGNDGFLGDLGQDTLLGGGGDDTLLGGDDADTLDGGSGDDQMAGGTGDDLYRVDSRRDRIDEGAGEGTDRIEATGDVSLRDAEIERVVLVDGGGHRVTGNGAATEIIGGAGRDVLIGGGGGDVLEGGGGHDFFAFLTTDAAGAARIVDFEAGDKLVLDDQFFGLGDGGIDLRDVTAQQISGAVRAGRVDYDGRNGELSIDIDGRNGPGAMELVVVIEGGGPLTPDNVMLF